MRDLCGVIPSHLRRRADALGELDHHLARCLPAECRPHCRVAGVEGNTLILITDSPVWRSRIHFLAPEIIRYFGEIDKRAIERLRVRVGVPEHAKPRRERRPPARVRPPAAAARALAGLADTVDDASLARSLRRLAARGQRESD